MDNNRIGKKLFLCLYPDKLSSFLLSFKSQMIFSSMYEPPFKMQQTYSPKIFYSATPFLIIFKNNTIPSGFLLASMEYTEPIISVTTNVIITSHKL